MPIIRNGIIIDPVEIENLVREHPSVVDALLPVHQASNMVEILVLLKEEDDTDIILNWCRKKSPLGHYIQVIRSVSYFPCSPAGKLVYACCCDVAS